MYLLFTFDDCAYSVCDDVLADVVESVWLIDILIEECVEGALKGDVLAGLDDDGDDPDKEGEKDEVDEERCKGISLKMLKGKS